MFHWFYNVFRVLINHDLDRFRATPERRISVDYGSRSNIVKQMVSAQICRLAAPLWAQVIDFILVFYSVCAHLEILQKVNHRDVASSMLTFALKAPWKLQFCSVNTKTIKNIKEI